MKFSIHKYSKEQQIFILLCCTLLALIPVNIYVLSRYMRSESPAAVVFPTPTSVPITLLPEVSKPEITAKQEPAASDIAAKNALITKLAKSSTPGLLYESKSVRIDYVESADVFQAEILITDIQAARKSAEAWFLSQGVSKSGMCTLPLQFYLNFEVKQQIKNTDISFSPLPDGC